ncbi:sugar kinase [Subtercola lobariae]|uniref:Ribokinase n=1 Tax=Subtercola lobariae TaxID=1588641 RepID=A0A917BHN5_9MICO|nr:sugar kinase [Subtercola lobariae]GGF41845.1 ribokinase [Subtercola lobariae]
MPRFDVVGIGEIMLLLQPDPGSDLSNATGLNVHVAGAELNACAAVASLGGLAAIVTRLGQDPFAAQVAAAAERLGVNVYAETDATRPTGVFFKQVTASDSRSVFYYRAGSAASQLDLAAAKDALALDSHAILLSGITAALGDRPANMMLEIGRRCHAEDRMLVLDANLRPQLGHLERSINTLRALLPASDILILGVDEAVHLFETDEPGEIISAARAAGCGEVVIKDGARGAYWADGLQPVHQPSLASAVVDTVGAGDSFTGGYVWSRLQGHRPGAASLIGSRLAARVVAVAGDTAGLPTRAERDAILAGVG